MAVWLLPTAVWAQAADGPEPLPSGLTLGRLDSGARLVETLPLVSEGGFLGGGLAVGDLGADGLPEIIIGSAPGQAPLVRIIRLGDRPASELMPYGDGLTGGLRVAVGDLDADGQNEIVTAAGPGTNGHVLVLDAHGNQRVFAGGFYPFGRDNETGASVAVGDINGDGRDDIVTASGPGSVPLVKVWRTDGWGFLGEFSPFGEATAGGVSVAAADIDGDGQEEVAVALRGGGDGTIRIFGGPGLEPLAEFPAADPGFSGGLNLAAADIDGDGRDELLAAPNVGREDHLRVFRSDGTLIGALPLGERQDTDGILIAAGDRRPDDEILLATLTAGHADGNPYSSRSITVDISEQRLRALEYGRVVRSFWVSTGTTKHPTPLGKFSVLAKPFHVIYRWSYGEDHPDNYDLGKTPYNLRIFPHIYIHYAPWHNNFGYRMSHGCINASLDDARWIYDWAQVGDPVTVRW